MGLTIRKIEEMAPDQASLTAAGKLKKPSKWPVRATDGTRWVWGECLGSGANPYRTVVDLEDLGYKCTCPSRKFPCKHALSLMWQYVDAPEAFSSSPVPEWVQDWLGRRRKRSGEPEEETAKKGSRASARVAEAEGKDRPLDPEAAAKKAAAAAKASERARKTRHTAILGGLEEVDRWLLDVLGQGLASFASSMHDQCRTLARRLVDAKAPGLAGWVDQLPAELLSRSPAARPGAAVEALGQIHLLTQAYRRLDALPAPLAADVRRRVGIASKREDVLAHPASPRREGIWVCTGARTVNQADDLQRVESWWIAAGPPEAPGPPFGLLVDYHPTSAGRIVSPFRPGDAFRGSFVFYPSACPLRALIAHREEGALSEAALPPPRHTLAQCLADYRQRLAQLPWLGLWPVSIGPAAIAWGESGRAVLTDGEASLPINAQQSEEVGRLEGLAIEHGMGVWDGWAVTLFSAETVIGRWVATETSV
ncbi:MAG: SWIM zinc finger family protein [Myxococcota bacterium]